MPNRSYQKGYRWERRVKAYFEGLGCVVFRQGKSRFPDLLVFSGKDRKIPVFFVECKWNKYLSKKERDASEVLQRFAPFSVAERFWLG